jgi:hypothetical protein
VPGAGVVLVRRIYLKDPVHTTSTATAVSLMPLLALYLCCLSFSALPLSIFALLSLNLCSLSITSLYLCITPLGAFSQSVLSLYLCFLSICAVIKYGRGIHLDHCTSSQSGIRHVVCSGRSLLPVVVPQHLTASVRGDSRW